MLLIAVNYVQLVLIMVEGVLEFLAVERVFVVVQWARFDYDCW